MLFPPSLSSNVLTQWVLCFRKNPDQFFFRVTLDIGTLDFYDKYVIEDVLKRHIRETHQLGHIMVTDDEFSFRDFGGKIPRLNPDHTFVL